MKTPFVTIACITFNHKDYIRDALHGFLMQRTDFPVEIIVHDDASTDGTTEIVQQYAQLFPKLIRPIIQVENQYTKGLKPFRHIVLPRARGKYIAWCEGDDYWIDPYKLYKQVQILEKDERLSLCYHAAKIVKDKKQTGAVIREFTSNKHIRTDDWDSFGYNLPTASIFFRRTHIDQPPDWFLSAPVGDIPLRLFLSQKGTAYYLNEVMSVRRIDVSNSWTERVHDHKTNRIRHYLEIIQMYEDFNFYTHKKYSEKVAKKILMHKLNLLKFEKFSMLNFIFENGKLITHMKISNQILFFCALMFFYVNKVYKKSFIKHVHLPSTS